MAGEQLTRPETAGGLDGGRGYPAAGGRGSLTAGPLLSAPRRKRIRGGAVLGRRWRRVGPLGRFARAGKKKKKGQPAWDLAGWARKGERERGREEFVFFFQISFKFIFQTFKLQSNENHAFKP
jgi:hypothetical protein